jgi:trehalose 6-phosphate synthase/phosphatase
MKRLLLVSSRLAVSTRAEQSDVSMRASTGGLLSAVRAVHDLHDGLWIGRAGGKAASPEERRALDDTLAAMRMAPVHLDAAAGCGCDDGFSSGVIWPLFHYSLDRVNVGDRRAWEAYKAINRRFADLVVQHYRAGDTVWVHDHQLMLVPAMLRESLPGAKIGFFLHVPFPALEVLHALPWREALLRGVLGADLVGLQTAAYRDGFLQAVQSILGDRADASGIAHAGRRVMVGVHPVGVDAGALGRLAASAAVRAEVRRIRERTAGARILLGVDRLDYTKGLPNRLAAIERLLDRNAALARRLCFLQLAPARDCAHDHTPVRREVNEIVARINGRFGAVDAMPLRFLTRSLPPRELAALYAAADVMLVTPLRDGMNLVAKEYVATRLDDTGALVLSELAGAAAEMTQALIVNPYDIEGMAAAIERAVRMPEEEQRRRMSALRRTVAERDVHRWAERFLDQLERGPLRSSQRAVSHAP